MRVDFTLVELQQICKSIGSEIDILEDELNNEKNKEDLSISRTAMLSKQILLCNLLDKTNRAIQRCITPRAALQKSRPRQRPSSGSQRKINV